MGSVSVSEMRDYLCRSFNDYNDNKLNGLRAEIDFRRTLEGLGLGDRVSMGGWLARSLATESAPHSFGKNVIAFFPHTIQPNVDYSAEPDRGKVPLHLHTICATFHQLGIRSYFGWPVIPADGDDRLANIEWRFIRLGVPYQTDFQKLDDIVGGFVRRPSRYTQYLKRTDTDKGKAKIDLLRPKVALIEDDYVPEEFSKENIRVGFSEWYRSEIVDIDGIFWGDRYTYPLEIKEKTVGASRELGGYFGIDAGPFVKLAFYAAKQSNMHSLFVVREIKDVGTRELEQWWMLPFEKLAQYASWTPQKGGQSMRGSASYVIRVPKPEFVAMTKDALSAL